MATSSHTLAHACRIWVAPVGPNRSRYHARPLATSRTLPPDRALAVKKWLNARWRNRGFEALALDVAECRIA